MSQFPMNRELRSMSQPHSLLLGGRIESKGGYSNDTHVPNSSYC